MSQTPIEPERLETYKRTPQGELRLHCFGVGAAGERRPGIVFFFGGGWMGGTPTQFYPHARRLSDRGMFAACAEYRVFHRHGTPPSACVRDGCSAVRWLRAHADRLGLDPNRLATGGGSAGGHVAAATAVCLGFDEPDEDLNVSRRPDALVLFNPVIDNSPSGYGNERVDVAWERISPLHNLTERCPPTIVLVGDSDHLVPVATCEAFRDRIRAASGRCELHITPGGTHGFFNRDRGDGTHFQQTLAQAEVFLEELGYLQPVR